MRRIAAALAVCLVLPACASKGQVKAEDLDRFAERTSLISREFTYERLAGGARYRIEGLVQDDYRYSAKAYLDDELVFEEVVLDDARYLRVHSPTLLSAAEEIVNISNPLPERTGPVFADPNTDALLAQGSWVVDPGGAPQEFSTAAPTGSLLDPAEILGRIRFIETVPGLLHRGAGVLEWNPDSAQYLLAEDKFPPSEKERKNYGDRYKDRYRASGKRFDIVPKPFDPAISPTSLKEIEDFFLFQSIWTKGRAITRFGRVFELPSPDNPTYEDFFQPLRSGTVGEATEQLLRFVQGLRSNEERRLYRDFYLIEPLSEARDVTAPIGAVQGNLKPAAPVETRRAGEAGPGQIEATSPPGTEGELPPGVVPPPSPAG